MSGEQEDRQARAARNQSLFREVNERLESLAATSSSIANTASFTCECADLGCIVPIEMSLDEYEAIRVDANRFLVAPDHVYPEVEDVVRTVPERYVVVAERGLGAVVAEVSDPRTIGA